MIEAGRVIIATGSLERPFPIPGWTPAGRHDGGRRADRAQGTRPRRRRSHRHGGQRAAALAAGGADLCAPAAKIDAIARYHAAAQLAAGDVPICPTSRCRPIFAEGAGACWREVPAPRCRSHRVDAIEAAGAGPGARGRVLHEWRRRARAAGRPAAAAPGRRAQREPRQCGRRRASSGTIASSASCRCSTEDFGSSVPGIAVAGDGAGIAGGTAAAERGRIAAIAAVRALRPDVAAAGHAGDPASACSARRWGVRFLDWLNRPAQSSASPRATRSPAAARRSPPSRCATRAKMGCEGPNQMKAFLRCGMGPCQGQAVRPHHHRADRRPSARSTPDEVGYYRLRPPVKPITLAELASLPISEAEREGRGALGWRARPMS